MAILTITATGLGPELMVGIPQLVELETNFPAVIYFTLDGSEPTTSSAVYVRTIQLPTMEEVRLRALAISGLDRGTLDVTYVTYPPIIHPLRHFDGYGGGIIVDAYGVPRVVIDGYGPDVENPIDVNQYPVDLPVRGSDIPLVDLDIKYSRTGRDGIGEGTITHTYLPDDLGERESEVSPEPSSPNRENVYFNPRSQFIVMDGRDGYQDQSVFIINRPLGGTLRDTTYLGGKSMYEPTSYISGSLVRSFYNYEKGIGVFYYMDAAEGRWIKSIQKMEEKLPPNVGLRHSNPPLVFAWIYNRRSMI